MCLCGEPNRQLDLDQNSPGHGGRQGAHLHPLVRCLFPLANRFHLHLHLETPRALPPSGGRRRTTTGTCTIRVLLPLRPDRPHPPPPHPQWPYPRAGLSFNRDVPRPLRFSLYRPAEPCCGPLGNTRTAHSCSHSERFSLSPRTTVTDAAATLVHSYGQQLVSRVPSKIHARASSGPRSSSGHTYGRPRPPGRITHP